MKVTDQLIVKQMNPMFYNVAGEMRIAHSGPCLEPITSVDIAGAEVFGTNDSSLQHQYRHCSLAIGSSALGRLLLKQVLSTAYVAHVGLWLLYTWA